MASAAPPAAYNVFVYGSLMADDVVRILLNHRFSIRGRVYPAIIPIEKKTVAGKILFGISAPELDILDTFEDVEYERRTVDVLLMEQAESLQAETYVWANKSDQDLYGDWDFEEWQRLHMEEFKKMTSGFMEELEQPESKPRVITYESFFQQTENGPPVH